MRSAGANLRPAWAGMGAWKWPCLLLLAYWALILYPYIDRSGGSNGMGEDAVAARLHDCPIDYEVRRADGAVTVLARLAAACALDMAPPQAALIDAGGQTLARAAMRGSPGGLRARLKPPGHPDGDQPGADQPDPDQWRLVIDAVARNGASARIDASPALRRTINAQPKD